jgi:HPt (histidine-containing phosphotransfer) domain-containing protein
MALRTEQDQYHRVCDTEQTQSDVGKSLKRGHGFCTGVTSAYVEVLEIVSTYHKPIHPVRQPHVDDVDAASAHAGPTTPESLSQECRLDMTAIATLIETSRNFANELVDLFVQDSRGRVEKLANASETGDYLALRSVAHSLKGSAGTIGARRLADLSHRLEMHAGGRADREVAARMVTEIRAELTALVATLADANLGTPGRDRGAA